MVSDAGRRWGASRTERTFVFFQVGGQECALPAQAVAEIVHMAALVRTPGQPSVIEGFLDLRGTAVPVLGLHRLFDLSAAEPGMYTPLIVLRGDSHPVALLADKVIEVAVVPEDALVPVGEQETFNGCVEVQASRGGRTVNVLSPRRVLLERERRSVAEFQARAQRYLGELEAAPE